MELETTLNISDVIDHHNVAELLSEKDLSTIAGQVIHDYKLDLESRSDWEQKNADSLKLALQVSEPKTVPWPNCANMKFPLITVAAMQGHAREYPALIYGTEIVKCRVVGNDSDGEKTARANRISAHMSYQLLEESPEWEDQMDRVIFTKYIVGSAFKKVYFDPFLNYIVSENILAQNLVIPYNAKSLEKASRLTHVIDSLSKNDIYERVVKNIYLDVLDGCTDRIVKETNEIQEISDKVQGMRPVLGDEDAPITLLEQHRYLDLDGDGYAEPYIVTVSEPHRKVLRIVARYYKDGIIYGTKNGKKVIFHISPEKYFVKYGMLPSPDGGIYDLGFGSLLGPLSHTVDTIINQLLDASTLRNLGAGFLGRGARLRRGENQFKPGEFKQTDSTNIKNDVTLLPTPEPSQVAFALLGLIINYGEKISGANDLMTGQNIGQNTPANTAMELVKQGSMIFNSIFKRTYRSLKEEYRMIYRLDQLHIRQTKSFTDLSTGKDAMILPSDYMGKDTDIRPAADPNVAGVEKRMQQALFLKQASVNGPGYQKDPVERRMLEAANIPYIDEVWKAGSTPPVDPKIQMETAKLQFESMKLKADMQYKMLKLLQDADKIRAEVLELNARAEQELAQAKGVGTGHAIAMLQTEIMAKKNQVDGNLKAVEVIQGILESMNQQQGGENGTVQSPMQPGGIGAMATAPSEQGGFEIPPVATGAA